MTTDILHTALETEHGNFLRHDPAIHDLALRRAKYYLDPAIAVYTSHFSEPPAKRQRRKLQQTALYLDGFDVDQVWEQVNSIVSTLVKDVLPRQDLQVTNGKERKVQTKTKASQRESPFSSESESDGDEADSQDEGLEDEVEETEMDMDMDGEMQMDDEDNGDEEEIMEDDMDVEELLDMDEVQDDEDDEEEQKDAQVRPLVKDIHGLNDGFFSIDDFNRQTEAFEKMDVNDLPGDSDEESIDYNADPDDIEDEDDDKDDYKDQDEDDDSEPDQVMYKDFFAPPSRMKSKSKPQNARFIDNDGKFDVANVQSEMDRVRRDLFDEDPEDEEDEEEDDESGGFNGRQSSHTKRQAALVDQIRQLEAANIAKRDWALSGEARAKDRPLNSLLEEDLDFETTGKPVPVITKEVTEDLETIIKRRILAEEFDELVRRRPDDVSTTFRRGRYELDDSKSQKSLAEIYEEDHLRKMDPANHPEAADAKLEAQHKEIELLFADVVGKLDALSSWHYTPKPVKPSLSIVADVRTLEMEEAQPATTGITNASQLAPQEVYAPGGATTKEHLKATGEILGKSGAPVAVREMTTDEKKRRRRREKERMHKQIRSEEVGKNKKPTKADEKKDTVNTLRRGGVTVIGKYGERSQLDGKSTKQSKAPSGSTFRL